jgi:hypothetical protein
MLQRINAATGPATEKVRMFKPIGSPSKHTTCSALFLNNKIGWNGVAFAGSTTERGLSLAWETLTVLEKERGEADPVTLWAMSGLALLYQNLGRYDEASRLNERHHEIWLTLPEEARVRPDVW